MPLSLAVKESQSSINSWHPVPGSHAAGTHAWQSCSDPIPNDPIPGSQTATQSLADMQGPNPWQTCNVPIPGSQTATQSLADMQGPNPWQTCNDPIPGRQTATQTLADMQGPNPWQ